MQPFAANRHRGIIAADSNVTLERLKERKRFIAFTRDEERILTELRPALTAHADEIVEAFYKHLIEFEALRPLLSDPEVVKRLRKAQKKYLLSLTSGRYGKRYLEDRLRIGRAHEMIGLLPQWYMGTYSFYIDLLHPIVLRHYDGDRSLTMKACHALSKLMNLDAQLVLEIYFDTRQQKAVERSEQLAAVGELSASIAHEVRNPLAGMKGALEVLRKGMEADSSKREIMDELVAQIVRLETLVRDLLTFAQPRPLNRHPVDLHEILERVLRLVQDGLESAEIRVDRKYQDAIAPVFADPQQLEQVFLNLIENAVQAMEGGGTLTLDTTERNGTVTITFRDTGKGIPPADLHRIFHPFFTTKHRGSGLGLSIVQKIVEAHEGSLRVESEPGQGTRIMVLMTRREPANAS
jgi:signal transduction histidine kinase